MSKKALLVGINKYPGDNELFGCVNDVKELKALLEQKQGYSSTEMRVLTDKQATRAAMLEGLGWLAEGAGEGDTRMFYYSGHGTRVPDENKDEIDGWDESLVPVDFFSSGVPLLDDTLNKAYTPLLQSKAHLLLVMDACHSGTVNKDPGKDLRYRFVKPKPIDHLKAWYARQEATQSRDAQLRKTIADKLVEIDGKSLSPEARAQAVEDLMALAKRRYQKRHDRLESGSWSGVLLAGCQDSQTSAETTFEGKHHGALTYYLLRALAHDVPTYFDLRQTIANNLEAHEFSQQPNLVCSKANEKLRFLRWK